MVKEMSKTAIITGGSGGIGSALVGVLKRAGWTVVSVDKSPFKPNEGQTTPDHEITVDVSNPEDIIRMFDIIDERVVNPFALICLAGVVFDAPLVGMRNKQIIRYDIEHWQETLKNNLTGTFLCCREYAHRQIRKRNQGVIITCSSPAADGSPGQCAYAASKAGIEAFTKSIARELAPWKIRACGIRPALTLTPMAEKYPAYILDQLISSSLIGRYAKCEEIAQAIMFLINSDIASGSIINFDGGIRL